MKINIELIKSFNFCQDGLDNFIKYHADFSGTELELLELDNVSVSDKFWLLLREDFIPENDLHELACIFAESVLHIFEEEYPNDDRPRKAIESKRKFIKGKISKEDLDAARVARDAARVAGDAAWVAGDAAWAAARAAARSAAWAAWDAWDAARSAAWAAWDAWDAAGDDGRDEEKQKQLDILKDYFRQIGETP